MLEVLSLGCRILFVDLSLFVSAAEVLPVGGATTDVTFACWKLHGPSMCTVLLKSATGKTTNGSTSAAETVGQIHKK